MCSHPCLPVVSTDVPRAVMGTAGLLPAGRAWSQWDRACLILSLLSPCVSPCDRIKGHRAAGPVPGAPRMVLRLLELNFRGACPQQLGARQQVSEVALLCHPYPPCTALVREISALSVL